MHANELAIFPTPAPDVVPGETANTMKAIRQVFAFYGIDDTHDNFTQFAVFLKALQTYSGREKAYKGTWKQYGALANLLNAARKVDRLMSVWWHKSEEYSGPNKGFQMHKDALDDGVDLLNYTAFFMRLKGGSPTGEEPERPTDG